jgi:hypothetical protein
LLNSTEPVEQAKYIIRKWRDLTPALARSSVQVSALSTAARGDTAEALGNLLTFAANQFNVGKNLSNVQAALLASEMLRIYWHWRFDEFSLVLREAVSGKYGTTYDRVDAPTVHEWCAKYELARSELEAAASEQQAREFKLAEKQPAKNPLASHPDYQGARQQLEALSDGHLVATARHYRHQRTADDQFIADVADEVIGERNLALVLKPIRERLEAQPKKALTLREQIAAQHQDTRDRLNAKLLAEGSPVWAIAQHWKDILDVEAEPVEPQSDPQH